LDDSKVSSCSYSRNQHRSGAGPPAKLLPPLLSSMEFLKSSYSVAYSIIVVAYLANTYIAYPSFIIIEINDNYIID